jgi:hypothetical protein
MTAVVDSGSASTDASRDRTVKLERPNRPRRRITASLPWGDVAHRALPDGAGGGLDRLRIAVCSCEHRTLLL